MTPRDQKIAVMGCAVMTTVMFVLLCVVTVRLGQLNRQLDHISEYNARGGTALEQLTKIVKIQNQQIDRFRRNLTHKGVDPDEFLSHDFDREEEPPKTLPIEPVQPNPPPEPDPERL